MTLFEKLNGLVSRYEISENELVQLSEGFIDMIIRSTVCINKYSEDYDSFMNVGRMALVMAYRNYEKSKSSFATYANLRIRGALIDEIRNKFKLDGLSIEDSSLFYRVKNYFINNGDEANNYDCSIQLKLPIEKVESLRLMYEGAIRLSLDSYDSNDDSSSLHERVSDGSDPMDTYTSKLDVEKFMNTLGNDERDALIKMDFYGYSSREVASMSNKSSYATINRNHNSAYEKALESDAFAFYSSAYQRRICVQ